jgi:hypothetical protein
VGIRGIAAAAGVGEGGSGFGTVVEVVGPPHIGCGGLVVSHEVRVWE